MGISGRVTVGQNLGYQANQPGFEPAKIMIWTSSQTGIMAHESFHLATD
jgi:hypothetical protein